MVIKIFILIKYYECCLKKKKKKNAFFINRVEVDVIEMAYCRCSHVEMSHSQAIFIVRKHRDTDISQSYRKEIKLESHWLQLTTDLLEGSS